jgi:hypothetical protein
MSDERLAELRRMAEVSLDPPVVMLTSAELLLLLDTLAEAKRALRRPRPRL